MTERLNIINDSPAFLPVCRKDMQLRNWDMLDFLFVTGDAYVDHPSFGHALLSRLLEQAGYRVGILAQPAMADPNSFRVMGTPRLGVLISSGVLDSMVNNYSAAKRPRSKDVYAPGGKPGRRPDRALSVYTKRVREAFGDIPIIIGGLEGSLRRFAHYDYWSNGIRSSILLESGADLLVFGCGERALIEIAQLLDKGVPIRKITGIRGTCYHAEQTQLPKKLQLRLEEKDKSLVILPSVKEVKSDKAVFARAFVAEYREQDAIRGRTLMQLDSDQWVVQNPPQMPLSEAEMDNLYQLPYCRTWHPQYDAMGGVPALTEVSFSITAQRGCFGGCTFCAIGYHQGRVISARSKESIIEEARDMTQMKDFKGYIHDVGGPTANFRHPSCKMQLKKGICAHRECLYPTPCKNLDTSHQDFIALLKSVRNLPGIKKVFVRSGVRYDYALMDKTGKFIPELVKYHVSGQLKVAPEHIASRVLDYMGKPQNTVYEQFVHRYNKANDEIGCDQYLVPYYISGHPGCTLDDAILLAQYIKQTGTTPEQVQQFIPVPGTMAGAMYWSELDPRTMKPIYVAKTAHEQKLQRALLQFSDPKNHADVRTALLEAGRDDLIGFSQPCLVKPSRQTEEQMGSRKPAAQTSKRKPYEKGGSHKSAGKRKRN